MIKRLDDLNGDVDERSNLNMEQQASSSVPTVASCSRSAMCARVG